MSLLGAHVRLYAFSCGSSNVPGSASKLSLHKISHKKMFLFCIDMIVHIYTYESLPFMLTLVLLKMPHPLLIFSQSDYLIWIVAVKSHTKWQTVQLQISWLLKKPTDLDLHCLQRQDISGFSMTRVNAALIAVLSWHLHCEK